MIVASIVILSFTNPTITLSTIMQACNDGIVLCIELLAIYSFWLGIMQIMEDSKLTGIIAKGLKKPINYCFGAVPEYVQKNISLNISSNLLGLGSVATPYGIKAMQGMDDKKTGIATPAMIMLVVINSTGLQLLPTTIIGMRAVAGSSSASDIVLPSLITTILPTLVGIFLVKIIYFRKKRI